MPHTLRSIHPSRSSSSYVLNRAPARRANRSLLQTRQTTRRYDYPGQQHLTANGPSAHVGQQCQRQSIRARVTNTSDSPPTPSDNASRASTAACLGTDVACRVLRLEALGLSQESLQQLGNSKNGSLPSSATTSGKSRFGSSSDSAADELLAAESVLAPYQKLLEAGQLWPGARMLCYGGVQVGVQAATDLKTREALQRAAFAQSEPSPIDGLQRSKAVALIMHQLQAGDENAEQDIQLIGKRLDELGPDRVWELVQEACKLHSNGSERKTNGEPRPKLSIFCKLSDRLWQKVKKEGFLPAPEPVDIAQLPPLFGHQQQVLKTITEAGRDQNWLVVMPTNSGKTRIAIELARSRLLDNPSSRIVLLAERVTLTQQHETSFRNFGIEQVGAFYGSAMNAHVWDNEKLPVMSMTAKCFLNVVEDRGDGYQTLSEIDLLVLDETHWVRGDSPMMQIMRKYRCLKTEGKKVPQVLGLTATPAAEQDLGAMDARFRDLLDSLLAKRIILRDTELDKKPPAPTEDVSEPILLREMDVDFIRCLTLFRDKAVTELGWCIEQAFDQAEGHERIWEELKQADTDFEMHNPGGWDGQGSPFPWLSRSISVCSKIQAWDLLACCLLLQTATKTRELVEEVGLEAAVDYQARMLYQLLCSFGHEGPAGAGGGGVTTGQKPTTLDNLQGGTTLDNLQGGTTLDNLQGGTILDNVQGGTTLDNLQGGTTLAGMESQAAVTALAAGVPAIVQAMQQAGQMLVAAAAAAAAAGRQDSAADAAVAGDTDAAKGTLQFYEELVERVGEGQRLPASAPMLHELASRLLAATGNGISQGLERLLPATASEAGADEAGHRTAKRITHAFPPVQALVDYLQKHFHDHERFHGMVFVQSRQAAYLLAQQLRSHSDLRFVEEVLVLTGHGSKSNRGKHGVTGVPNVANHVAGLSGTQQQGILNQFRKPGRRLLVSTAAGEEGLDVQACELVVRYSAAATGIQRVQSRGRARKEGARYYTIVVQGQQEDLHSKSVKEEQIMYDYLHYEYLRK